MADLFIDIQLDKINKSVPFFQGTCYNRSAKLNFEKASTPTGRYAQQQKTVAVYESHPDIHIDDNVYIHTLGVKQVTDYCPDCSDITHLDYFLGEDGGCTNATDAPGNTIVIKLF